MRARLGELLQSLFFRLYLVTAAAVFAVVLLLRDGTSFAYKTEPLLPGWALLLGALCGAVLLSLLLPRLRTGLEKRFPRVKPGAVFILLFFLQVYVCYNCYFETGWEVGALLDTSLSLADGYPVSWNELYFQKYMNNTLITWLFSLFIRISRYIGILDVEQSPYMAVIPVQCALSSLAGWLVFRSAQRLWKSDNAAWGAGLLYVALAGFSPWLMIPYTDSMGLIMPILLFWLYLTRKDSRRPAFRWVAIGAVAYWSYRIKPQCVICAIAVFLIEAAELLKEKKLLAGLRRRAGALAAFALAVCVSSVLFSQALLPVMNIHPDQEMAFGPAHFFMMGLNERSNGGFNGEDVKLSNGIYSAAERNRTNMAVAAQRIRDYGPLGLLQHTAKKTLNNFGDGSFAWSQEGSFYLKVPEPKNRFVSPLLRNLYYSDGVYYKLFLTWAQVVWLLTLCAPLGLFCLKRRDLDKETLVLMLSVFGLTLFETLFEARARYLFTYVPYFVLLAAAGWRCGRQKLLARRKKAI